MIEKRGETGKGCWLGPQGGEALAGARTPEELDMLFEDAILLRDSAMLAALFEGEAVLIADGDPPCRGGAAIARLALTLWEGDRTYVAAPPSVVQTRDLALIVAERAISVVRRGRDGTWRYIIAAVSVDNRTAQQEA